MARASAGSQDADVSDRTEKAMKYLVGAEMIAFNAEARRLNTGFQQMQLGLQAVALNNADFVALARSIAKEYCAKHGSVTIDNVRCDQRMDGRMPSSPNAWGSIFMETGWRLIGYTPSQVRSNHHRRIARWTWQP